MPGEDSFDQPIVNPRNPISRVKAHLNQPVNQSRRNFLEVSAAALALQIPGISLLAPSESSLNPETKPAVELLKGLEPIIAYNFGSGVDVNHFQMLLIDATDEAGFANLPYPKLEKDMSGEPESPLLLANQIMYAYAKLHQITLENPNLNPSETEFYRFLRRYYEPEIGQYNLPNALIPPEIQSQANSNPNPLEIENLENLSAEEMQLALFIKELTEYVIDFRRFATHRFDLVSTNLPINSLEQAKASTMPHAIEGQPDLHVLYDDQLNRSGSYPLILAHEYPHLLAPHEGIGPFTDAQTLLEAQQVSLEFIRTFDLLKDFLSSGLKQSELPEKPKTFQEFILRKVWDYQTWHGGPYYAKFAEVLQENSDQFENQFPQIYAEFQRLKSQLRWFPEHLELGYSMNANSFPPQKAKVGQLIISQHIDNPNFRNFLAAFFPTVNFDYSLDYFIARYHYQIEEIMAFIVGDVITNGHWFGLKKSDKDYSQYLAMTETVLKLGRREGISVESVQQKIKELSQKYQVPETLSAKERSERIGDLTKKISFGAATVLLGALFATKRK